MKRGMTLTEVLVTIAVMILLFALTMPAVRAIKASLGAADELPIILGFARTAAMREQGYAGCAVVTQANGEVWAFLLIPDDSHVYTPAEDAVHAIALRGCVSSPAGSPMIIHPRMSSTTSRGNVARTGI